MRNYDLSKHAEFAKKLMSTHSIPGAAVGVAVEGQPVYKNYFGWRDVEQELPIDDQTVFGIASVTKSVTAVAIMQLQEQGKLSVAEPVVKYLPEFKVGKQGAEQYMTIHHFLTHTTGIPPLSSLTYTLLRSYWEDCTIMEGERGERLKDLQPIDNSKQLMEYIAALDLQLYGHPGEYFSYSNDCFGLLGEIVARVSGRTYEQYVTENILRPLGMERSTFSKSVVEQMDNVATLYSVKRVNGEESVRPAPVLWQAPAMTACGFLKSTLQDMMHYVDIYRTGGQANGLQILSQKSIDQMCTPYATLPTGGHYGYGLMVQRNYNGVSLVEHGGNLKGVASWITCMREKGITGVALTTLQGGPSSDLVLSAMNLALGLPVQTTRREHHDYCCPKERLVQYQGAYQSLEQPTAVRVSVEGGCLSMESEYERHQLRPVGLDTFVLCRKGIMTPIRFLRDTKGETWGMFHGVRLIPKV